MLRCDQLSKSFDGVHALAAVDLRLWPSGITAVIGPNGAGKTTLLNIVTGFLRADAGQCFLGEQEITRLTPERIAGLGVARTFQDVRLMFQASVLANLMLARPNQRGETLLGAILGIGVAAEEARNCEEAMRLLEFVGLEDKATELAAALSYGQQKLLALACCLGTGARILLLDEPVAGVHPDMAAKILSLLCQLRDQSKRIVFVEHDIAAVRLVADHVIVMDEGRVIAQGAPQDVLSRPEIMEAYLG
jgi:ABC-type branched-subunit amino acid transport system ATPase component